MKLRKNTIEIKLNKTQDRDLAQMRCQDELTSLNRAVCRGDIPAYFAGDPQEWESLKDKIYDTEVVSISELIQKSSDIKYHSRDFIEPHHIKDSIFEILQENDSSLPNNMLTVKHIGEILDVDQYSDDDLYNILFSYEWGLLEKVSNVDEIVENHVKIFQVNGYSQGDFAHVFVPAHMVKNDQDEKNIGDYLQKLLFDCPYLFRFDITLAGVEGEFDFFAREIDAVFDEYEENGIMEDVIFKEVNTHLNENGFNSLCDDEKEQLSEYFNSVDVEYN